MADYFIAINQDLQDASFCKESNYNLRGNTYSFQFQISKNKYRSRPHKTIKIIILITCWFKYFASSYPPPKNLISFDPHILVRNGVGYLYLQVIWLRGAQNTKKEWTRRCKVDIFRQWPFKVLFTGILTYRETYEKFVKCLLEVGSDQNKDNHQISWESYLISL